VLSFSSFSFFLFSISLCAYLSVISLSPSLCWYYGGRGCVVFTFETKKNKKTHQPNTHIHTHTTRFYESDMQVRDVRDA
jgi:hypothetical protein